MQDSPHYAGFLLRAIATVIDVLLLLPVIYLPLSVIYGADYWQHQGPLLGLWDGLLNYVLPLVLTLWFWRRFRGTPGKMLLRLRVVDAATGNTMTVGQSLLRYFAYIPAMLPLGLGLLWIGWDRRKQGWHDKIAGSVVIREPRDTPAGG